MHSVGKVKYASTPKKTKLKFLSQFVTFYTKQAKTIMKEHTSSGESFFELSFMSNSDFNFFLKSYKMAKWDGEITCFIINVIFIKFVGSQI